MGITATQLLPRTIHFLIAYEVHLIQAEWLLGIRTAIRLNNAGKAQKIAEELGEILPKVTSELCIYERYQFQLLVSGESANKGSIPLEQFPDRRGKSLGYMKVKIKAHEVLLDVEED